MVIIDDEPLARDSVRIALQHAPDASVVAECGNGEEGVRAIRELAPDVVFLDVQMPEVDGFGVIARVGPAAMPPVVFVTAFDAHAVRAFEVHALDYVLKPFDDARLLAAYQRARTLVHERRQSALGRRLADVLRDWAGAPAGSDARGEPDDEDAGATDGCIGDVPHAHEPPDDSYVTRFAARSDGRIWFIPASSIDWIESDGNYVVLCVGAKRHRVRGTLRDVMARLDPRAFARVHKSAIVNLERIRELQPWFGGDYVAILRNGAKLKVSRRHVARLLRPMA